MVSGRGSLGECFRRRCRCGDRVAEVLQVDVQLLVKQSMVPLILKLAYLLRYLNLKTQLEFRSHSRLQSSESERGGYPESPWRESSRSPPSTRTST